MRLKCRALAALTILAASPLEAGERLSMRLTPAHAFEPATVRVTAVVERDAQNRAMEIVADSGGFYRSSLIPLEGDTAPRTTTVDFQGLPGGDYEVRIILLDAGGHPRATVFQSLDVISNR